MTTEIDAEGLTAAIAEGWSFGIHEKITSSIVAAYLAATRTSEAAEPLFTYQRTFDAIAAAVAPNAVGLGISVKKFIEAFGPVAAPYPSPVSEEVTDRAADLLEHYADFIRNHVKADDIEMHPYLPDIEDAIASLRSPKP